MRGILTGRRGLASVLLVVVVVWALAAVLMLTGTLVAARQIKRDVAVINPEVGDIEGDTRMVALAKKTARISGRISKAATPLTGELDDTLNAANGIDDSAKSILKRAQAINGSVKTINGSVAQINPTVNAISGNLASTLSTARSINGRAGTINANARSINTKVRSINSIARSINTKVRSINSTAQSINANAGSINTSVRGIRGSAGGILTTIVGTKSNQGIDRQVQGINNRASDARKLVIPIRQDLDAVLTGVGAINAHAESIQNSNLLVATGADLLDLPAGILPPSVVTALNDLLGTPPPTRRAGGPTRRSGGAAAPAVPSPTAGAPSPTPGGADPDPGATPDADPSATPDADPSATPDADPSPTPDSTPVAPFGDPFAPFGTDVGSSKTGCVPVMNIINCIPDMKVN